MSQTDSIQIGVAILDISDQIQTLMESMSDAYSCFSEGSSLVASGYYGKAEELVESYFSPSMDAHLGKIITYYGICAQCIVETFEELMETDREIMEALLRATYGGS